jgi:hypothetical protein
MFAAKKDSKVANYYTSTVIQWKLERKKLQSKLPVN